MLNCFTATACKIYGLKSAHIHASCIFDGPITNLLSVCTVHFDRSPFTCSCEGGQKSLNGFKFGTLIGRFPGEGTASLAAKGLILSI